MEEGRAGQSNSPDERVQMRIKLSFVQTVSVQRESVLAADVV